jgi:CBS domain containing-hemolysin-like protein
MTADAMLAAAAAGYLLTLVAALGAEALRGCSRHQLQDLCRRHGREDRLPDVRQAHRHVAATIEALRILAAGLTTFAVASWLWGHLVERDDSLGPVALAALAAAALALLLAAAVWLPQAVVRFWGEALAFHTWPLWRAVARVLAPLGWGAAPFAAALRLATGRPPDERTEEDFEQEIRSMVSEGQQQGHLEEEAREMIESVIQLHELTVAEIMTPRTDMVSMHVGLSLAEAVEFAIRSPHSRIPVYDKSRDDVVGILYVRDLLPLLSRDDPPETVLPILRAPAFVPETKPVDDLLQEFQQTRNHLAVVLDEYGGVSGVVTIEDALEEIVGEIRDEYDLHVDEGIRRIDQRTSDVQARVRLAELNQRLGLDLPETGEFETLAGFVFHELGRLPAVGETLVRSGVRLTVQEVSRRRIERVRVELLDGDTEVAGRAASEQTGKA